MISLFGLRNNQKNKPVSDLHTHTSIKLNTKHALVSSHSFLLSPELYSKQMRFKRCDLYMKMNSRSYLYTGLFPGQCNVVIITVNGGPVCLSCT